MVLTIILRIARNRRPSVESVRPRSTAPFHPLWYVRMAVQILLKVGEFNWEDYLPGQQRFIVNKCPVDQCFMTDDITQKQSADALLITEMNKGSARQYLPKPLNQILIVKHHVSSYFLQQNLSICLLTYNRFIKAPWKRHAYTKSYCVWKVFVARRSKWYLSDNGTLIGTHWYAIVFRRNAIAFRTIGIG